MDNNSSENYLDQLLFSMDGGASSAANNDPVDETPEETLERELFGVDNSQETRRAKDEEAFLREFEEELLKDDIPNHIESLDRGRREEPEDDGLDTGLKESLDDMIDRVAKQMDEHRADVTEEPEVDENAEFSGELPETSLEQALGAFDEQLEGQDDGQQAEENLSDMPLTDDGELDLSGLGDSDLLDMLSGDGELSDLGDMLSDEAEGNMLDQEDSISSFAEAEMAGGQQSGEPQEEQKAKKKKKGKKEKKEKKEKAAKGEGGFFAKLSKVVFGEDDEEEKVEIKADTSTDVSELSEENQQILAELEAAGEAEGNKKKKEKKPKKKKEKKPKPKKEKKPKPPKPKKEKKPKEVDKTPPLPKKPVIAIVIMTASLFGFVMLMTSLLGYQVNITQAKDACEEGSYVEAYQNLQGIEIKEKDEELYYKLAALAAVSEKYNSYLIFENSGKKSLALDALICACGRCEINLANAKIYEFEPELEELKGKIVTTLLQQYDMTGEEALELYQSKTRKEYTLKLQEILEKLGLE